MFETLSGVFKPYVGGKITTIDTSRKYDGHRSGIITALVFKSKTDDGTPKYTITYKTEYKKKCRIHLTLPELLKLVFHKEHIIKKCTKEEIKIDGVPFYTEKNTEQILIIEENENRFE